ncbi:O-sialoglycoprotein endopeptidase, putative [Heliorestis convoluta]|uniref:N(6)-L-threonylcarbamoyladenine synthase n=2 Tax=Heliorestis convoluta TaxID=356322 RepID=A0A5Q2MW64_9FIRM|nr:O-sialoglycoprotein endopeptidase, putative [Heliorestis convoluta]
MQDSTKSEPVISGILAFDTSCYTTSLAFVDERGKVRAEKRRMLPVKKGERGLRQGDAFFLHGQHLPELLAEILQELRDGGKKIKIEAVAISTRPRPEPESYLPVFRAGYLVAHALATTLEVPLIETSHQEGHIMAGLYSAQEVGQRDEWLQSPFLAVHLSGGTTELLRVQYESTKISHCEDAAAYNATMFQIKKLGGTLDLHAGQLVDRVGVALGLSFPAGPELEKVAARATEEKDQIFLPAAVKGYNLSFSGAETAALRMISKLDSANDCDTVNREKSVLRTGQASHIARAVERCIASTLEKILRKAVEEEKISKILIVGGVAANTFLRQRLRHRLEHKAVGAQLAFATPQLSGDNAVGVALIGHKRLETSSIVVDPYKS